MNDVVLWGYFKKNLGDDLMLRAFIKKNGSKYRRIYINSYKAYQEYYLKMGVTVITMDSLLYRIINKLFFIFKLPELFYWLSLKKNRDFVMLGGSLFMESSNRSDENQINNLEFAVDHSARTYVIGSNFGPYSSEKYFQDYKRIFNKCYDVCFRDKYSYNLFSELSMVRYAPDVILSGEWDNMEVEGIKTTPFIVISVLDLENRTGLNNMIVQYEKLMTDIALYHAQKGELVFLASFCKAEGDEIACMRIKKRCGLNENVKIINYDNFNILKVISNADRIYGTRFHSIILAMYYGIPCMPFIYGEKTYNALCAYSKAFHSLNLKKLSEYSMINVLESCEKIELFSEIKEHAKKQFK